MLTNAHQCLHRLAAPYQFMLVLSVLRPLQQPAKSYEGRSHRRKAWWEAASPRWECDRGVMLAQGSGSGSQYLRWKCERGAGDCKRAAVAGNISTRLRKLALGSVQGSHAGGDAESSVHLHDHR